MLGNESAASWDACFALGRRVQRCFRRMTRRRRAFSNVRGFFKSRTRLLARLAFLAARRAIRTTTGPETNASRGTCDHVLPRSPQVITARDRAKTRTRQRQNFCCASRIYSAPHSTKTKSQMRISSAQEPLRPMPLPRASRVSAARRSAKRPRNGVRHAATTGRHALHAALPAKSGRTRPPLPIPSAAKFHPPTENHPRPN